MSQATSMAGDSAAGQGTRPASTGRAVLLLAVFVVLGIALLHEMDNAPTGTTAAAVIAKATQQAAPVATTPVTTAAIVRSPADVKVLVANGIGTAGVASKVAGRLQPIGYQLLKPGNTVNKETNSLVEFTPGYQAEAQALATSLSLPATAVQALPVPSPVTDLQGGNLLVIVGTDLANSPQTQSAQAADTGTTVAGAAGATATTSATGAAGATATTAANPTNGPLNHLPGVSPTAAPSNTATTAAH